jgi:hypothetical protein
VKILLDENMPESLVGALEDLGHKVDSVNHLKLKGLVNGTLYRQVAVQYDLCFTRDVGFAHNVRPRRDPSQVKVLRVIVPQQRTNHSFRLLLMLFKSPIGRATRMATIGPSSKDICRLVEKHWESLPAQMVLENRYFVEKPKGMKMAALNSAVVSNDPKHRRRSAIKQAAEYLGESELTRGGIGGNER